jgi:putative membrane protein
LYVSDENAEMNHADSSQQKPAGATDHLANERTFLAWIRTSIALMGFGFVIVKFALFLRQLSFVLATKIPAVPKGDSAMIGVTMVALGAVMAVLAYVRYLHIEKQLNNNSYFPSRLLTAFLTIAILAGSILLVIYLLPNI